MIKITTVYGCFIFLESGLAYRVSSCIINTLSLSGFVNFLRSFESMRNTRDLPNLISWFSFQEWVTDNPFVISPRITFEVSVRLLGGLMALGYTIATILKRNSHAFSDDRVCVKIDWLEQLNRQYIQVLLNIFATFIYDRDYTDYFPYRLAVFMFLNLLRCTC